MRVLTLFLLVASSTASLAVAPPTPTGLKTTSVLGTSITLDWDDSTNATNYIVFRNGTQVGTPATSTFNDTGLTAGTSYSYTVSAVNTADEPDTSSGQSEPLVVSTASLPATPTNLRGTATSTSVTLSWSAVSGATEYVIYRNSEEYDTSTTTTFTDTDVETSTTYRYSVAASSAAGDGNRTADIAVTTKGDGTVRNAVWTKAFNAADGNYDGIVEFNEYLNSHPTNKLALVIMYHRFISCDDDDSGDLTVDEYIAYFGGKIIKRPSKAQSFYLADTMSDDEDSGDGLLTIDEYALTLNRTAKESQVIKKFNKLDKNPKTDLLSEQEFGLRYGAVEAD